MASRIFLNQSVRHLFKKGTTFSYSQFTSTIINTRINSLNVVSMSRNFASTSDESNQSEDAPEGEISKKIDPSKDRRNIIPVEVSMSYLKSKSRFFLFIK